VDDIVREFLIESNENLDRLDRNLVELEKSPRDQELLADIFRTIHSIKGTTGFLGFHHLEAVAHAGENLLSRLRDGLLVLNPAITTGLLTMVDAIREMLKLIESTEADGDNSYPELIASINALMEDPGKTASVPAPAVEVEAPAEQSAIAAAPEVIAAAAEKKPADAPAEPIASIVMAEETLQPEAEFQPRSGEDRRKQDVPVEAERRSGKDRRESSADSNIRVDVSLLERLMDLVGELVLTRNQIIQFAAAQRDSSFVGASQKLNLVTSDMREIIMKTRLQPIQNVMGKFPRMVRDLALACEKQVRIETTGQETELDRTILEAIKDPLTHAVRNSVDHGIETPAVRLAAGKPAEGVLSLRAFHEGGQVNIEISDDGAGIDPARIRAKAIEKGLITTQQAERMSQHEIISLVFKPGFSTAAKITNVSGRGVGMDVVRTNIEKIGGTVDIQSVLGQGSTVRMKIPLTLAIIPVLIVRSAGQRFAIPQVSLLELLRLEAGRTDQSVEMVHGAPVYRLRGNLLPLLFLSRELKQSNISSESATEAQQLTIVVLQAEGQQFGLVVDEIHDAEEIVVKPLGQHLKHITAFSGATVMGDGEVALILDIVGLAKGGRLLTDAKKAALQEASLTKKPESQSGAEETQELLLFRTSRGRRTAVALSSVDRLEEFKISQFELAGQKLVVQYRGQLLPIVNLSDKFDAVQGGAEDALLKVLVCSHQGERMGVVVDQIIDVAQEAVSVQERWKDSQSHGSAVIQKQVTDFLDLKAMMESAHGGAIFSDNFAFSEATQ
jgi:two-component system, chemotaxis family, sensor kinase CheA